MVVHAEVEDDIGEAGVAAILLHDEERGRLLAAAVAAGSLSGVEAVQEPLLERPADGLLEGLGEGVDGCAGDEDVPLRGVARPGAAPGPALALLAGEGRAAALPVDDAELPVLPLLVGRGQALDDLLGGEALPQQRQAVRPVAGVGVGLRSDGAGLRLRPGHDGADAEKLRCVATPQRPAIPSRSQAAIE